MATESICEHTLARTAATEINFHLMVLMALKDES